MSKTKTIKLPEHPELEKNFPQVDYAQWKAEAETFLNGAPFEKKLVARTPEGVSIQPLYTSEALKGNEAARSLPGQAPYLRGTQAAGFKKAPWYFCQEISAGTPADYNKALLSDLARGQNAVYVLLDKASATSRDADLGGSGEVGACGVSVNDTTDMKALFNGIVLDAVPVQIPCGASPFGLGAIFAAYCESQGYDLKTITGAVTGDPFTELATNGALPACIEEMLDDLTGWVKWASVKAPMLRTVGVNAAVWHEAGGSATEELAFSMATGAAYLKAMLARGIEINTAAKKIQFNFALGPRFFSEIAKLRAARLIWARIVDAFGGNSEAQKIAMHTRTGLRNKTVYDPYVNMLRTTTEALSGVLGGTDSMHIGPFDEVVRIPGEFSRRIARNTHTLLAEEFNFCETIDPAGGSWYIEKLTDDLARAAWSLFQEVEAKGGIVDALTAGFPQERISIQVADTKAKVDSRRTVLLGTNLYPNPGEKALESNLPDYGKIRAERVEEIASRRKDAIGDELLSSMKGCPAWSDRFELARTAAANGATLHQIFRATHPDLSRPAAVQPLKFRRDAADFEALRDASKAYAAKTGSAPLVFLARMGPIPQNKARADFSTGFFQTGGFECLDKDCFKTATEAAEAFLASKAKIAVLCSTDDNYPELVPAFAEAVKKTDPSRILVLAGHPGEKEEAYRAAGFDAFIHIRSNVRADLTRFLGDAGAL